MKDRRKSLTMPLASGIFFISLLVSIGCNKTNDSNGNNFFPVGKNYKWVYVRNNYVYDTEQDIEKGKLDTLEIKISKITPASHGWILYKLEGGSFEDVGKLLRIKQNRWLPVFNGLDTLKLTSNIRPKFYNNNGYERRLAADKQLYLKYTEKDLNEATISHLTVRKKGIGVLHQETELHKSSYYEGYTDNLLYFIKGRDTVWRAETK